jgi:hypothetical protein
VEAKVSLYVVVTFDLRDADASDYDFVKEKLEEMGLVNYEISREGKMIELPANVYVGEFDDDFKKPTELRDFVTPHLKKILKDRELKGRYFVFVGENWAWRIGKV